MLLVQTLRREKKSNYCSLSVTNIMVKINKLLDWFFVFSISFLFCSHMSLDVVWFGISKFKRQNLLQKFQYLKPPKFLMWIMVCVKMCLIQSVNKILHKNQRGQVQFLVHHHVFNGYLIFLIKNIKTHNVLETDQSNGCL